MKKEYIKPEAEMMKFVEAEEIMNDPASVVPGPLTDWGTIDSPFGW